MAMKETNCEQALVISNLGRVFLRPPARGKIRDETEIGLPVGSRQSNIDKQEVASSGFFYEDVTCTARWCRKLRNIFGETISFLYGLGYIHVLYVIRWGPTYSFPSVNFSNRSISEILIPYFLYSALCPCKFYCNIYRTEDTLGINICTFTIGFFYSSILIKTFADLS